MMMMIMSITLTDVGDDDNDNLQIVDVLVTCCCCMLMRGNPHEADTDEHDEGGYYERFPPTEVKKDCSWRATSIIIYSRFQLSRRSGMGLVCLGNEGGGKGVEKRT